MTAVKKMRSELSRSTPTGTRYTTSSKAARTGMKNVGRVPPFFARRNPTPIPRNEANSTMLEK